MRRRLAIGIGSAVAVLAAGGGVAALTWPDSEKTAAAAPEAPLETLAPDTAAPEPAVRATLDTLDLVATGGDVDLPQRKTKPFSLLGITWTDPKAKPQGAIEVRTRAAANGKWSSWRTLEPGESGADPATESGTLRGATEPAWVGASNGVAARIAGSGQALPAGLRLDLIDPGKAGKSGRSGGQGGGEPVSTTPAPEETTPAPEQTTPAPEATTTTTAPEQTTPPPAATTAPSPTTAPATSKPATTPTTAVPVPTSTVPVVTPLPSYVSRAQWSADEKLVTGTISVASQVRVLFVHHTADSENYDCKDSPAIVRAIQKYHVKSNGWSDIGYNFVTDKCGTLFEGRRGGVTKAVVGAHTYGFNTNSAGIAVIGHYSKKPSPGPAEMTIAQVAAARLGAYGFNPTTKGELVEGAKDGKFPYNQKVSFNRIAGHRDGVATECPGTNLYARLPNIRAQSVAVISGLALKAPSGAAAANGAYYAKTAVTANWSVTTASAALAKFEVLLDNKVYATTAGSARSASVRIPAGAHTIAVRGQHVSGARTQTATQRVYGDVTAPTFPTAPSPSLRGGTYSTSSVPVAVGYRAADNLKLGSVAATSPKKAGLSATGTGWNVAVKPNAALKYTLTAKDLSGNARTSTVSKKVTLLAETKAKKTGKWTAKSGGSYLNGKALTSSKKNTKLTFTFTGRSAALLFARGAKTGKALVYLDGKKVATVDTKAGKNAYRQALWVKGFAAKKHTVQVVVVGTAGRPAVTVDGLAFIN